MTLDIHSPDDLRRAAEKARRSHDALVAAIDPAVEIQWDAAPIPRPREDTSERGQGAVSNPTLDIALDPRRLAVRAAMKRAAAALAFAGMVSEQAARDLRTATAAWSGEDLPTD